MKIHKYDAVVVGSGASGFSAAVRIAESGKSIACITEGVNIGTSRNTGSDKQTYYKLSLGGKSSDSVAEMAENLFSFGAVDGDTALCEAALSARCFYTLAEGGVPFPHNRYGEYVGYKTDHDPFKRATTAGPLTSKYMTEMWEKKAKFLDIPIFDGYLAIEILHQNNRVYGLVIINKQNGDIEAICSSNVILATGGPAGAYADSVYPESQNGSLGLAVSSGIKMQNLTEWQYGLASVNPKWNVSGTYMQVLPRFVSVDEKGNEYEFLFDSFKDPYEALSLVFLKGYQWPFDCKKLNGGSSIIDLLVYYEKTVKNRRVFLDFTKNPLGMESMDFSRLSNDAYDYLKQGGALSGKPIDRLLFMNKPAVELYLGHGIDISREYLEIALCAQHHNGGISVSSDWECSVKGLFAIGECAGTHGISRPGGSALNAGQVGALRAADCISRKNYETDENTFRILASEAYARHNVFIEKIIANTDNVQEAITNARRKMSDNAAAIRSKENIKAYLKEVEKLLKEFEARIVVKNKFEVYKAYIYKDILLAQNALLFAMLDYEEACYSSRGSAIIHDNKGFLPTGLDEMFRFRLSENTAYDKVQEIYFKNNTFHSVFRPRRPIPSEDEFFENVWREYRKTHNIN